MSRQYQRSPHVSRSASPESRLVPPVVVDLTTTLEGRTLVIGAEDSLICGPCKDNGINSHGARHLCRCENMLAATVVNRRVKQVVQSLKDNWQWSAAVKRGLALPSTPGPEVVKKIRALGNTDKKLLKLGEAGKATLQKVIDDFLSNYWSSLGLPVDPLVAQGLPAFVALATTSPPEVKVKVEKGEKVERVSRARGRAESRGRASRHSSGGRRRHMRRSWSSSSDSSRDSSCGSRDHRRYKKGREGPSGPPAGLKDPPAVVLTLAEVAAAAAAAAVVASEAAAKAAEAAETERVAAVAETERVAAVAEADRIAAVAEAECVAAVAEADRVAATIASMMPPPDSPPVSRTSARKPWKCPGRSTRQCRR
jgi:hypothetical protein